MGPGGGRTQMPGRGGGGGGGGAGVWGSPPSRGGMGGGVGGGGQQGGSYVYHGEGKGLPTYEERYGASPGKQVALGIVYYLVGINICKQRHLSLHMPYVEISRLDVAINHIVQVFIFFTLRQ